MASYVLHVHRREMAEFVRLCQQQPHMDRRSAFQRLMCLNAEDLAELINNGQIMMDDHPEIMDGLWQQFQKIDYETEISRVLDGMQRNYPVRANLSVHVYPMSPTDTFGQDRLGGVSGWVNWDGAAIWLVVYPRDDRTRLQSTVVHEYHHHYRIAVMGNGHAGISLLEKIVREGLAEQCVAEVMGPAYCGPWIHALTEENAKQLWQAVYRDHWEDTGNATDSYVLGGGDFGIPHWAGYAMGYYLIKWYRETHRAVTMQELSKLPCECFMPSPFSQ